MSEAERLKHVTVLNAQAEAEQDLVRQVKQAEADETRSKHKAVEINNPVSYTHLTLPTKA